MSEILGDPRQECADTRQTIAEEIGRINNTDYFLDEGDAGYEEQQTDLSEALVSARDAFAQRPPSCAMEGADDAYECNGCSFLYLVFDE